MPRISIIMPLYNAAPYLSFAIESVLDQTMQDWELIIVDDASTDESARIAASFRDRRIHLIRLKNNQGAAAAKNIGIEQVRADFLAFLDADDVASPQRFERQLAALEKAPNSVVGARAELIDGRGQHLGFSRPLPNERRFRETLLFRNCLVQTSIALADTSLRSLRFRSEFEPAEDYDLWVRLMGHCRIFGLNEVLVGHRVHGKSLSARFPDRLREAVEIIHRRLLSGFDSRLDAQLHRQISEPFFPASESWLRSVEAHLNRILATNVYFDDVSLRAVVKNFWIESCCHAWTLGWKSFAVYHASPLSRRVPTEYFRLAWRCSRSCENSVCQ
jgi:glycosyltransferase involved in cell wall biosynthesis